MGKTRCLMHQGLRRKLSDGSEGWKWTPGKMEMVGPGVMANSVFAGEGHQNACPCQIFVAF